MRRVMPRRRDASDTLPAQSVSTRWMCSHSARASEEKGDALEAYCINLNKKAKDGKIDPLIGRESEINRTIQVLCRRQKNNPLYVGEAGVGKTAIAEGLAR